MQFYLMVVSYHTSKRLSVISSHSTLKTESVPAVLFYLCVVYYKNTHGKQHPNGKEKAMDSVLYFKNSSYYADHREATIQGDAFQTLMDLCFAHGDAFSLHRCQWPGAHDGTLEQALRPYLLGEYFSYGTLICFERKSREKCYLYSASQETKEILLRHIHHLFDSEKSLAPAGHQAYLDQKYADYVNAYDAASTRWIKYLHSGGSGHPKEQREFAGKEIYREARALWEKTFQEDDYYSYMEDLCFFRSGERFFETVTHEQLCSVRVLSPEFQQRLCKLGDWVEADAPSPPFLLQAADGWKQYVLPLSTTQNQRKRERKI